MLNFLTIFSMMSGGIREIMPFIRYAAQYVDIEWATIKAKVRIALLLHHLGRMLMVGMWIG